MTEREKLAKLFLLKYAEHIIYDTKLFDGETFNIDVGSRKLKPTLNYLNFVLWNDNGSNGGEFCQYDLHTLIEGLSDDDFIEFKKKLTRLI